MVEFLRLGVLNSNTTLVKVKFSAARQGLLEDQNSNTTLVKVKFSRK